MSFFSHRVQSEKTSSAIALKVPSSWWLHYYFVVVAVVVYPPSTWDVQVGVFSHYGGVCALGSICKSCAQKRAKQIILGGTIPSQIFDGARATRIFGSWISRDTLLPVIAPRKKNQVKVKRFRSDDKPSAEAAETLSLRAP